MPDVEAAATIEPWNDVRELVRRCQQGDLCAFTALFERFQDRVYDLASAILEDRAEAEDALQRHVPARLSRHHRLSTQVIL